jgi:glycosyltransferase involved in cell wall biosynthesis
MKKKLLIVHNFYRDFGGEDANIQEELEFFENKYDVKFFYANNNDKINFYDILSFLTISNKSINKRFKKELDTFRPDLVYIHNTWFKINLGIFRILNNKKIETVVKIHNFRYDCSRFFLQKNHLKNKKICSACGFETDNGFLFNRYYKESFLKSLLLILYSKKYFKILTSNKFNIISINNFQKKKLEEAGVVKNKLKVIYNPINFEVIQSSNLNEKSLIYAGRISKEKGVDQLIKAFELSDLADFKLNIVGEGDIKAELQNIYRHNKSIKFLGHTSNSTVLRYIKNSTAVVTATTLYEGQPRLLCEASSLKTVSIYPSFGGMDEFFPKNYKLSFEQFNYKDLVDKLNLLLDDEFLKKASENVHTFLLEKLNSKEIINNFDSLFKVKN